MNISKIGIKRILLIFSLIFSLNFTQMSYASPGSPSEGEISHCYNSIEITWTILNALAILGLVAWRLTRNRRAHVQVQQQPDVQAEVQHVDEPVNEVHPRYNLRRNPTRSQLFGFPQEVSLHPYQT